MIISILNQKGGVGKTTLAVNIARALTLENSTLLVDSDIQGSARDWHAAGKGEILPVIGLDRPTLSKDIKQFVGRYDYIIIDGAGKIETMSVEAIKCSDIVLIPVAPSPYDIWAASDLVEIVKARQSIMNGTPKAAFVINLNRPNTTLSKEVEDALQEHGLPVFTARISLRTVFAKSAAQGLGVVDFGGEAASEIYRLIEELKEFAK